MHIHRLRIEFPEDCLMKMFTQTLEERERLWYERLPPTSIYFLEGLYSVFCKEYKESYPSIELVENFCGKIEKLFQHMGIDIDDEDLMEDCCREKYPKLCVDGQNTNILKQIIRVYFLLSFHDI